MLKFSRTLMPSDSIYPPIFGSRNITPIGEREHDALSYWLLTILR
jgi:hypothetical protein